MAGTGRVDALQEHGFDVHLAHPKGLASFQGRRVKTDWADARELVDLLRLGRFPESYIAPVELRELRELVRHWHKLVQVRTGQKASVHAVLGKCGVIPTLGELFGPGGTKQLACWAGLTPRVYSSDAKTRHGHISKQGSRLLRWAAIEACQRTCEPYVAGYRQRIRDRRGKTATQISKVAAARKLLHVVYYVLRDGNARCLQTAPAG